MISDIFQRLSIDRKYQVVKRYLLIIIRKTKLLSFTRWRHFIFCN